MKNFAAALSAAIISASFPALAAGDTALEKSLTDALRLKPGTSERVGKSGAAIKAYAKAGFIGTKADKRADYTDYHLLKKPAPFMGHTLVVLEQEYMVKNVGCCVSPGLGLTVKLVGGAGNLEAFAKQNGCKLSTGVDPVADLKAVGIKATLPPASYATLSCRERDAS